MTPGAWAASTYDLKSAASAFVDTLDEATNGTLDGVIANGRGR